VTATKLYTALATYPRHASREFPGNEHAIADVRHWLGYILADTTVDTGDVILCASELATNAIRYSHSRAGTFSVVVGWDTRRVQVLVLDDGPLPEPPPDTDDRDGGRGLFIINQLAQACSWETHAAGRIAWFRINLTERPS
jgi:anti-sigma regulatory factor (Ser/Thr protein kinase)